MLHIINSLDDPLLRLLQDDPVRPDIPKEFRVSDFCKVFVLQSDAGDPEAVVCCAYRCSVPATVEELAATPTLLPHVAVFYTIWSYRPGSGRRLILQVQPWLKEHRTNITEFVTLSPPTEMARIFHLRNGAEIFRINSDTVNYLYP